MDRIRNIGDIIPEDCVYMTGNKQLSKGEKLPAPKADDTFVTKDYVYLFVEGTSVDEENDERLFRGWEVHKNVSRKKGSYIPILHYLCNEPIVSLYTTFMRCSDLKIAPEIPPTVKRMTWAFAGCSNLEKPPKLPNKLKSMYGTFEGCAKLKSAPLLPSGLINLRNTFMGCKSLIAAPDIPDSVKYMDKTFERCTNLTVAPRVPDSVVSMKMAFKDCTLLVLPSPFPKNVKYIESAYENCRSLKRLPRIPESVEKCNKAFARCVNIEETLYIDANIIRAADTKDILADVPKTIVLKGNSKTLNRIATYSGGIDVTIET